MDDIRQTMQFPGQKQDETVQCVIRKHWIIFVFLFFKVFFLILLPLSIMIALTLSGVIADRFLAVSWSFFLLLLSFGYATVYISWLNEELDTVIITSERIINVDQISFMHRAVSETSLAHLSDVRGRQRGIWADVLNYGDVELQAGSNSTISKISYVMDPFKVAEKIVGIRNEFFLKHSSVDEFKQTPDTLN